VSNARKVLAGVAVGIGALAAAAGLARGQEAPPTTTPPATEAPAPDAQAPENGRGRDGKMCDEERGEGGGGQSSTNARFLRARGNGSISL
jgi:hypothetical protein